jgi:flagellar biosynthesis chaperone FliJ
MATGRFVFRAAAALDLRRKREESAQRARLEAAAALQRAEAAADAARAALDEGLARGAAEQDPSRRLWYRTWMTRQHQEIARRRAMAADRRDALDAATAAWQRAHRDVRALERLRDRMQAAWATAVRRAEQKELDWLGCVQYALAPDADEEERQR